jgi:hypothetical protein
VRWHVEAWLVGFHSRKDEVQRFQPWSVGLCPAVQSEGHSVGDGVLETLFCGGQKF